MRSLTILCVISTIAAGCLEPEEATPPTTLEQHYAVSECGGFADIRESLPAGDYCGAERLLWSYDAATETLELSDTRVSLNCCGDRAVELEVVDGNFVVTETDAPGEEGRCYCTCVFDFSLTATGVAEGTIPLRIEREVTDGIAGAGVVWQGVVDLSAGSGEVEIDTGDVDGTCEGAAEEVVVEESVVSECGGFEASLDPPDWGSGDYCAAEQLRWTYDGQASTIELSNERVLLNCCGERSVDLEMVAGTLVITETDAPDGEGGRCSCTCVFDFAATASGIAGGSLPARLVRDVTDAAGGPVVVWEGSLDLSAGSGDVVTSTEDAGGFCETP